MVEEPNYVQKTYSRQKLDAWDRKCNPDRQGNCHEVPDESTLEDPNFWENFCPQGTRTQVYPSSAPLLSFLRLRIHVLQAHRDEETSVQGPIIVSLREASRLKMVSEAEGIGSRLTVRLTSTNSYLLN